MPRSVCRPVETPLVAVRETLRLLHTRAARACRPSPPAWSVICSYDAVRRVERLPIRVCDDLRIPELAFLLASDLAVLDHHNGEVWLVANAINFDNTDERVDEAYADAAARGPRHDRTAHPAHTAGVVSAELRPGHPSDQAPAHPEEYQQAVSAAVEEIKAGEAFQIVVSQRFEVDTSADALDIYRVLRLTNPSPYM